MAKVSKKKPVRKKAAKKTAKKAAAAKPAREVPEVEIPRALLERITQELVVHGTPSSEIDRTTAGLKGYEDELIVAAVAEVRARMHRVAQIDRLAEIGESLMRLKRIVALAYADGQLSAAVSAQTQINKLLALFPKAGEGEGSRAPNLGPEIEHTLERIEAHLRPLELAPAGYPIEEVARIAAQRIQEAGNG